MKFRVVLFVLFMMLQALLYPVFGQDEAEERMRGIWVTTVFHLDYPSVSTTDVELLKKEAISIIENVRKSGLNTIFLQVRPSGDALYPSKYVKWSKFLTGKKGIAPSGSFDPLQFWIEEAHKRGIKLHAWMNPYRIATDMNDDVGEYPADRILKHDGRMYLNPGIPEVQKHLLQVVEEVLARYDVDGIHFDDYFYPEKDVDDQVQYEKYGAGLSIQEWRIRNVDTLIREVHDLCRKYDVRFGVSPFGIWANRNSHPLGSDTEGFESLISQYADSRKWVTNEWVDYICPQIYWHKGFRVADYEVLADWWSNVVEDTDVDLYIGVASFKAMDKDTESPWYGTTELLNQLNYNTLIPNIDGEIHFRYASIFQFPVLRNAIANFYANQFEVRGYADKKLIVGRPYEDTVTYSDSFFIGGMSNPDHKLYINGELIDDRTKSGLFGRYYALSVGDNIFELVNGNERYTRVVTRKAGGGYSSKPIRHIADIFPKVWRAYRSGEEFELSCVAPAGSEVYAKLGGYVYRLEQSGDVAYGHPARYTKKVSFSPKGKARVEWLGNVVYECYQDGVLIASAAADKPIEIIMEGAPLYAEVLQDFADTYVDNSRELGAFHMIPKGTKDYVTGEDGDLYRLGSGLWVKTDAVKLVWKSLDKNRLNNMFVKSEGMTESVVFESAYTPVFYADQEEDAVAVKLHQVDFSGVNLSEVRGKLIEKAYIDNGRLMLKLKNPDRLGGYYTENIGEGKYRLVLREKKKSTNSQKPLENIVILIDPGHGGRDSGGISLFGTPYSEKAIVLDLSFRLKAKLEEKGAKVLLTRVNDLYVSLYDRLRLSRKVLPDMFLSIHTDSLYESSDLSKIRGASVFYKHPIAARLAERMAQTIYERSELNSRGHHYYNFYVCRGTWAPSLLLENGFACSPFDLEFVMDKARSEKLLNDYVDNILEYFRQ